jgi:hypothetical protein
MLQAHPFPPHGVRAVSPPAVVHDQLLATPQPRAPGDALSTDQFEALALYIEGWSEADAAKIADATVDDYDFHDPLVGHFSKRTLAQYFALLRSRFADTSLLGEHHLGFMLRGPFSSCNEPRQRYWREAPCLGLSGTADIIVTSGGVAAEAVAYELNIACEVLRVHHGRSAPSPRADLGETAE